MSSSSSTYWFRFAGCLKSVVSPLWVVLWKIGTIWRCKTKSIQWCWWLIHPTIIIMERNSQLHIDWRIQTRHSEYIPPQEAACKNLVSCLTGNWWTYKQLPNIESQVRKTSRRYFRQVISLKWILIVTKSVRVTESSLMEKRKELVNEVTINCWEILYNPQNSLVSYHDYLAIGSSLRSFQSWKTDTYS